jgi:carbon monoxide dehydrogenase subunit G
MRLEFSGSPVITAARDHVWNRLLDPRFVAASAPGVESVESVDPTHFKVITALGLGALKIRFRLEVELFDIVEGERLKMRARGHGPGSAVAVLSDLRLEEVGPANSRLDWFAISEVSGPVAILGSRLLEMTARQLTEQFWTDFARRASAGG